MMLMAIYLDLLLERKGSKEEGLIFVGFGESLVTTEPSKCQAGVRKLYLCRACLFESRESGTSLHPPKEKKC